MQISNFNLEDHTIGLVNNNFIMPIDANSQKSVRVPTLQFLATSEKALLYKKEFDNMEQMLQDTNRINFQEMHCESQRSSRQTTQQSARFTEEDRPMIFIPEKRKTMQAPARGNDSFNNRDVSFDIVKLKLNKQLNIEQAFQQNLKAKKTEILELEARYIKLTQSQNVKLTSLSQLKNQRVFYQQQYNIAAGNRKQEMMEIKVAVKKINQKIKEYNDMHANTVSDIVNKIEFEKNERLTLVIKKDQLDAEMQKLIVLSMNKLQDSSEIDKEDEQDSNDNQRELEMKIRFKSELISQLKMRGSEAEQNIQKLQEFISQSQEECQMTQEEILTKTLLKREMIAQREELDQMYEMGRISAGQEFQLFIKLQEVKDLAGSESSDFLQQEYDQFKTHSFLNDIVQQLRALAGSDDDLLNMIDEAQQSIKRETGIVAKEHVIRVISELTSELNMQINEDLLLEKFNQASAEKDKIFTQKYSKLKEISNEIERYELLIQNYQNSIANVLSPQASAYEQTLIESNKKRSQLIQQRDALEEKLQRSKSDLNTAKGESQKSYDRLNSQININTIKVQIAEVQLTIESKDQKINKLEKDKNSIDYQFEKSLKILNDKKAELQTKLHVFDPFNASMQSAKSSERAAQDSATARLGQDKLKLQDEQLREVLDGIDRKIGQQIEEKELESKKMQLLHKQIQEAKDCFTSAYRHYKTIKKEAEDRDRQSVLGQGSLLHDLNDQMVSKEELLSNMPHCFSSEKKGPSHNLEQFVSFSQQSVATPFKQVDSIINANPYSCYSPVPDRRALAATCNKENQYSNEKGRSSSKKSYRHELQTFSDYSRQIQLNLNAATSSCNNQEQRGGSRSSHGNADNEKPLYQGPSTQAASSKKFQNLVSPYQPLGLPSASEAHLTPLVGAEHAAHGLSSMPMRSPQKRSSKNQPARTFSNMKERLSSQKERFGSKAKRNQSGRKTPHRRSSQKRARAEKNQRTGSSSLLYEEDYLNEVFACETEPASQGLTVQPFEPDRAQQQNEVEQRSSGAALAASGLKAKGDGSSANRNDFSSDIADVWALNCSDSAQLLQLQPASEGAMPESSTSMVSKTLDYNQFLQSDQDPSHLDSLNCYRVAGQDKDELLEQSSVFPVAIDAEMDRSMLSCLNEMNRQPSAGHAMPHKNSQAQLTSQNEAAATALQEAACGSSKEAQASYLLNQLSRIDRDTLAKVIAHDQQRAAKSRQGQFSLETAGFYDPSAQQVPQQNFGAQASPHQQPNATNTYDHPRPAASGMRIDQDYGSKSVVINLVELQNAFDNKQVPATAQKEAFRANTTSSQGRLCSVDIDLQKQSQPSVPQSSIDALKHNQALSQVMLQPQKSLDALSSLYEQRNSTGLQANAQNSNLPLQQPVVHAQSQMNFNTRQNISDNGLSQHTSQNIVTLLQSQKQFDQSNEEQANKEYIDFWTNHNSSQAQMGNMISKKNSISDMSRHQSVMTLTPSKQAFRGRNDYLASLAPLLQGALFYKKFGRSSTMNQKAFDPLRADVIPPESCGYGIRFIQLDANLKYFNIRQQLKNTIEFQIPISDIVKPIIPQITLDIIKAKKQRQKERTTAKKSKQPKDVVLENVSKDRDSANISHLVKIGVIDKNSKAFQDKCSECMYFPFSIALLRQSTESSSRVVTSASVSHDSVTCFNLGSQEGRIELIATSYDTLKAWVMGINLLIKSPESKDLK